VHAEYWGPSLYWRAFPTNLRKAVTAALVKEAKRHEADAVIDLEVRVESHYSALLLLFIFGWEECHATGTAIKYK
jgi:uncharacterized protein YbjQ (UPF0145 family)